MARPKKKREENKEPVKKVNDDTKFNRLLTSLEKKYSVTKGSDIIVDPKIRTKIYPLDYVLDGGIAQAKGGHKIEFYGGESSGKTTFSLMIIAEYQRQNKLCVFINAENSYDPAWAERLGVDSSKLIVIQPETLEDAGEAMLELIPKVDLILLDSIVALVPLAEVDRDLTEKTMGAQASVNSTLCRKINKIVAKYKTTIIFINQLREKIGQMYGNPETTAGGRALKHLYDTRISFRAGKPITKGSGDKKETIGLEINLLAKKNKKGVAYRKSVINFYIDGTIDNKICLFYSGIKYDVIKMEGHTYTFEDKKAVGKESFLQTLTEKDWDKVEEQIWKRMKG